MTSPHVNVLNTLYITFNFAEDQQVRLEFTFQLNILSGCTPRMFVYLLQSRRINSKKTLSYLRERVCIKN